MLELHTLGIDGNYTQDDILTVARALTGWKVNTKYTRTNRSKKPTSDTYFTFVSRNHDIKAKAFLGNYLPPNRGIEDGEEILDIAASYQYLGGEETNLIDRSENGNDGYFIIDNPFSYCPEEEREMVVVKWKRRCCNRKLGLA